MYTIKKNNELLEMHVAINLVKYSERILLNTMNVYKEKNDEKNNVYNDTMKKQWTSLQ